MDALSQSINPYPSELGHHPVLGRSQQAVNKPDLLDAVVMNCGNPPRPRRSHNHIAYLHILDRLHSIGHQDLALSKNAGVHVIIMR